MTHWNPFAPALRTLCAHFLPILCAVISCWWLETGHSRCTIFISQKFSKTNNQGFLSFFFLLYVCVCVGGEMSVVKYLSGYQWAYTHGFMGLRDYSAYLVVLIPLAFQQNLFITYKVLFMCWFLAMARLGIIY